MTRSTRYPIFVGTYTPENEPSIHTYFVEAESGDLTHQHSFTGIKNPSFLAIHPSGRFLYAVSEIGMDSDGQHGAVWALEIESDGSLKSLNQRSSEGDWPCHVVIDQTGRFLIASNYGTGNAALYPILPDGRLGDRSAFIQHVGSGPNEARQEQAHAHSAIFTPDNKFLLVADLGIDQVVIYRFDEENGTLHRQGQVEANAGAGPRHFAFHQNGRFLYVANELDSTVTGYKYDSQQGTLTPFQTASTLAHPNPESFVADIHFSADSRQLYVSNRGDNSVATFAVDEHGRFTLQSVNTCGGNWPRNFMVLENGRFLLVANRRSDQLSVLSLDENGVPQAVVGEAAVGQPSCVIQS